MFFEGWPSLVGGVKTGCHSLHPSLQEALYTRFSLATSVGVELHFAVGFALSNSRLSLFLFRAAVVFTLQGGRERERGKRSRGIRQRESEAKKHTKRNEEAERLRETEHWTDTNPDSDLLSVCMWQTVKAAQQSRNDGNVT